MRRSVATYGLTHIALRVRDPASAFSFYRAVLGVVAVYKSADFIQAQTLAPGTSSSSSAASAAREPAAYRALRLPA